MVPKYFETAENQVYALPKNHERFGALFIIPVMKQAFNFCNLPPEIRNMIYKHLLTSELEHDIIDMDILSDGHPNRGTFRSSSQTYKHHNLLMINKQIKEEAQDIFWGQHGFAFETTTQMRGFVRWLTSDEARHIRSVYTHASTKSIAKPIDALCDLRSLQHLELSLSMGRKTHNEYRLAQDLFPLVVDMKKRSQKMNNYAASRLLVTFVSSDKEFKTFTEEAFNEHVMEVREELLELLNIRTAALKANAAKKARKAAKSK